MTGWRIGFMAAPTAVARAVSCFQDQVTSNPTSFAQKGAIAALEMECGALDAMKTEFQSRRDLAMAELAKIPGLTVPKPDGAFYLFVGVEPYLKGKCPTDADLAELLLEDAHVALVPGSVFEGPGFLRLSYTASREDIVRGIGRIAETLARIA